MPVKCPQCGKMHETLEEMAARRGEEPKPARKLKLKVKKEATE